MTYQKNYIEEIKEIDLRIKINDLRFMKCSGVQIANQKSLIVDCNSFFQTYKRGGSL